MTQIYDWSMNHRVESISWFMIHDKVKTYFAGAIHLSNFKHFNTLIFTFFVIVAIVETSGDNNTICISAKIPLDIFFHVLGINRSWISNRRH